MGLTGMQTKIIAGAFDLRE
jgi:CBS domain containing-hemolysin-like protein